MISLCGTWMQTIGQDWLVLKITGSATQLGIVSAFQFLPVLLLGPFGGVIADRFDKRKVLLFTQSVAGILALILGILVVTNSVQIWMIYVLALCLGLVNTINAPSQQTFVPEMVGRENLSNAVRLFSVLVNVGRAVGPAIAGIVIASFGIGDCFIINAISYIAVIIGLSMMDVKELQTTSKTKSKKGGGSQLMEGFRYVKNNPVLLNTLLMMTIIGTLTFEFSVSLPVFAKFSLGGDASSYAFLVTAMGTGSIVGGILMAGRKKASAHMLVVSALLFGIFFTLVSLMPNIYFAMALLFLTGLFSTNFIALGNTMLQLESKPEMRGRVMSLWSMAFMGSTPIGGPIIGWISEYAGPRFGIATGGIAAIIAAGFGAMVLFKKDKSLTVTPEIGVAAEEVYMSSRRLKD